MKKNFRDFNRFAIEFEIEVVAEDIKGQKIYEKTKLRDISGEGANFITKQAGKYFPGQLLEMTIYLLGTDEVKACMRGKATVVRIDPPSYSGIDHKSRGMSIAVKLDTRLNFERFDSKTQGKRREPPANL